MAACAPPSLRLSGSCWPRRADLGNKLPRLKGLRFGGLFAAWYSHGYSRIFCPAVPDHPEVPKTPPPGQPMRIAMGFGRQIGAIGPVLKHVTHVEIAKQVGLSVSRISQAR